ncbi:MAG: flagellin FliC [Deltaproteobacteria bacterium]|nr:flagellin FliC [Deltaproteobacteria bacterium]
MRPVPYFNHASSLTIQGHLRQNQDGLSRALARLASGRRVNTAADDAATVSMIDRIEARSRSYVVAGRNTAVALEMTETAEGGAGQIVDALQRMREIAVEAGDGALTSTDRGQLDTEYQELLDEIDRLAEVTTYNGRDLLAGASSTVDFQVGIDGTANDTIGVAFGGVSASNLGVGTTSVTGSSSTNADAALTAIDSALGEIGTTRAKFGAAMSRLGFALSNGDSMRTRLEGSLLALRDADIAEETSLVARYQVLLSAGAAALASANGMNSRMVEILLGLK